MKWRNIFSFICAVSTGLLMTYMTQLYGPSHIPDIINNAPDTPVRKSWPPAAWWRSKSPTSQLGGPPSNSSATLVTPSSVPENVTGDVIPPIAFDINSTDTSVEEDIVFKSSDSNSTTCVPHENVVFIKTHKTGSTSLSHIVNRYGFAHNLSFVFNRFSPSNGHLVYLPLTATSPRTHFLPPIGVKPADYSKYKYNMLAVHVRYSRKAMDTFMKPNTFYISVIRDPGTQFESAFTHFQLDDSFPALEKRKYTTMQSRLTQFFTNPDFYRKRLKMMRWEGKMGLRWYYAKNNQIFDLGLDHVYHADTIKVKEYIKKLDREFKLMLITEYFEESLVVMKKLFCWTTEDILFVAKNVRPNPANIPETLRGKMRAWNEVDTQLYDHFNRTLWLRIQEYGPAFEEDLAQFRQRLKATFDDCVGGTEVKAQGHYFHWIEYKPRSDSSKLCAQIAESKKALFAAIWRRQQLPKTMRDQRPVMMNGPINMPRFHRYPPAAFMLARPRAPPRPIKPPFKSPVKPIPKPGGKPAAPKPPPGIAAAKKPLPPQQQKVVKHVAAHDQSKSHPADSRLDDVSSSVIVIHGPVAPKPVKSTNQNDTSTGTRVKAVMTYKKNS